MDSTPSTERSETLRKLPAGLAMAVVLVLLVLLVYGLTTRASDERIDQSLSEGVAAPAASFELPVLEGGTLPPSLEGRLRAALADDRLSLEELRGTPLVLNFWASWCDPCREEAPILNRGWARHGPQGVLYLGLDMQDVTSDARVFLNEFDVTYQSIRDQGDEVARSYGATGIPETYFVTGQGRVVAHVIGVVSDQQLDEGTAAARSGRVAGTLSGGARREQR